MSTPIQFHGHEPSYAHPEAPTAEAHDCPGCGDETDSDLCDDCGARHADLGGREYPNLSTTDAAWLDRVDDVLSAMRRAARRAA